MQDEVVEISHIKSLKSGSILCFTMQWRSNMHPLYFTWDFYIAFSVFSVNIEMELK